MIPRYAGVTVLMRYTLRLLTLDQLSRATALMCALELMRKERREGAGKLAIRDRPVGRLRRQRPTTWASLATEYGVVSKVPRLQAREDEAAARPAGEVPLVRRRPAAGLLHASPG